MSKTSKSKSKRVTYGFKLDFPEEFTMSDLREQKNYRVKYITLYMRVKNGLKNGVIVPAGVKVSDHTRRGRKEIVYRRADAKTSLTSTVAKV